jgi:hypothetical protein
MRYVPPPPITSLPSLQQIEASCAPQIRAVMAAIRPQLLAAYAAYEAARPDTLHQLPSAGLNAAQRSTLELVFKRRYGQFRSLLNGLSDHFESTGESTCPYCNFGEQWEHDHYLPKRVYPEFALYPNNLIPICKPCNGKKLARIQQNGVRLFKHLFSELNGVVGFLQVTVGYHPELTVEYVVVQAGGLTAAVCRASRAFQQAWIGGSIRPAGVNNACKTRTTISNATKLGARSSKSAPTSQSDGD